MSANKCQTCGATLNLSDDGQLCLACLLQDAVDNNLADSSTEAAASTQTLSLPRSFGAYELLEELDRGGMGVVFRARQLNLDREVAIKLLLAGSYSSEVALRRFELEASAAAGLQHPNIVGIHDYGHVDGQPFYTMDLVVGKNLAAMCNGNPIAPRQAAQILTILANAVQHAHQRGILHRDLKPSNVIIDAQGAPHITDFGLAKLQNSNEGVTLTGQAIGSPGYSAPEQARQQGGAIGPTTDVYGLGALLFHMLTGRAPFTAPTPAETFRLVLDHPPPSPRLLNPELPRDLETICLKCLETDPERRYKSATEVADDAARFLADQPIRARPPGILYRFSKYVRRHWIGASAAAAVCLALLGGLGAAIYSFQHAVRLHREAIEAHGNSREIFNGLMQDLENRSSTWDPAPWIADALRTVDQFRRLPSEFRDIETKRHLARVISLLIRNRVLWVRTVSGSWTDEHAYKEAEMFEVTSSLWDEIARSDPSDDEAAAAVLRHIFRREIYREAQYGQTGVVGKHADTMFTLYDTKALKLLNRFPSSVHAELAIIEVRRHWMAILAEWGEAERSAALAIDVDRRDKSLLERYPRNPWILSERDKTIRCLSYCYRINGKPDRSYELRLERLQTLRLWLAEDPENAGLLGEVAQSAGGLTNWAKPGELDRVIREAMEYIRSIRESHPDNTYWRLWEANMHAKSGFSLATDRRLMDAMSEYEAAFALLEGIPRKNFNRHKKWVWYLGNMGSLACSLGNSLYAEDCLNRLRDDRPLWVSETVDDAEKIKRQVSSLVAEHHILESLQLWTELEKVGWTMAGIISKVDGDQSGLGYPIAQLVPATGAVLGRALLRQGNHAEALPWLEKAGTRIEEGVHLGVSRFGYPTTEFWHAGEDLAEALVLNGEPERAREVLDRALREREEHVAAGGKLLSRIAAARCSWKLAQILEACDPAQSTRREELLARAAQLLDRSDTAPRLLPEERELRAQISKEVNQAVALGN